MDKVDIEDVKEVYESHTVAIEILAGIVICLVIYGLVMLLQKLYRKVNSTSNDTPVLLHGLVDGTNGRVIRQDPNDSGSVTLYRSINESGIAYTYSLWMYIDGKTWSSFDNRWKHVFHKGPRLAQISSRANEPHRLCPIQCPGLWIHPSKNTLRLYVNTFATNKEYLEIDNLPVKKWINLVYTQSDFVANVFINGRLKLSRVLKTLPRQNYYNVHISQEGGFDGYLSSMQYFNYVLYPSSIHGIVSKGPVMKQNNKDQENSSDKGQMVTDLPYLSSRWWANDLTMN